MKEFENCPGSKAEEFVSVTFDPDPKAYHTSAQYLCAFRRAHPDDMTYISSIPQGENRNGWIYSLFRQFLVELNSFTFEHRDVCTSADFPRMEYSFEGHTIVCQTPLTAPPSQIPAIDYFRTMIDHATTIVNDQKLFQGGGVSEQGLKQIETQCRRLYRIFSFSYAYFPELFGQLEDKDHLCERFTTFVKTYGLIGSSDIHVPSDYWERRNQRTKSADE